MKAIYLEPSTISEVDTEVVYEGAKKVGMERNFVEYSIRDYKLTHDVYAACWFAYCEWDL